jgi:hypothetical protein
MFCLDAIPCCLNLIVAFFGLESIKGQYELDADFKDVFENCKEGRSWNKVVMNDGYLFRANRQLVPFILCCYRRRMEAV